MILENKVFRKFYLEVDLHATFFLSNHNVPIFSSSSMESDNARSVSYSSDKFPPPSLVQARLTHTGMILYENLDIKIKVEIKDFRMGRVSGMEIFLHPKISQYAMGRKACLPRANLPANLPRAIGSREARLFSH